MPFLRITVADTGIGMTPDVLRRAADPFFTTKPVGQGTGLGLNIVQRLIKEAKGALRVQTRVGEGTTFTVYVPAAVLGK